MPRIIENSTIWSVLRLLLVIDYLIVFFLFWMSLASDFSALLINRCSSSVGAYDLCGSTFSNVYSPLSSDPRENDILPVGECCFPL